MTGPPMPNKGASKQDYGTPREFVAAVERRFGPLGLDLAAHEGNHVTPTWYGPGSPDPDAILVPLGRWRSQDRFSWLNPPFANIAPWAERCAREAQTGSKILFLVPASVGANWFAEWVFPFSHVLALQGRLSFDGKNPFPKDCMLCVYGVQPGFSIWGWRTT